MVVTTVDGKQRELPQPNADDVVNSSPPAWWTVEARPWGKLAPELSDDVLALVAPMVVVGCQFPTNRAA